jgi:hypothetical protein
MTRTRTVVGAVAALLLLAACGDSSEELPDPTVTGVVAGVADGGRPALSAPSDDYYDRMSLVAGDPEVQTADGETINLADLRDGDRVSLWITGACAESYPVQCPVDRVRVDG